MGVAEIFICVRDNQKSDLQFSLLRIVEVWNVLERGCCCWKCGPLSAHQSEY